MDSTLPERLAAQCCSECGRPFETMERNGVAFEGRYVIVDGKKILLSPTEADMMRAFVESFGATIHRNALFFKVWGAESERDMKIIDIYVLKLRRRLAGTSLEIRTAWGMGYGLFRRTPVVENCDSLQPTSTQETAA